MPHDTGVHMAIFLPSLRGGGAERVMLTLANGFAECGHKVDLVLARAEGTYLEDVLETVRIVDLDAPRVLMCLPGLVRYLRRERPATLLSALNYANVVAVAARWLSRVPTRLVISEHANFTVSRANAKLLRARFMGYFMLWAYPRADGVVAVSSGVAVDLAATIGLRRQSIQVIYNPVVTPDMIARSQQRLDHPWLDSGKPPVVLGVGRLTPQKDFSLLIRAFAQLRTQREARLMILGEGECRPELEVLVHELGLEQDVVLPGFVNNPYPYMHRVALFVLSSRWEGFGNVLAEAMACGTPVISTDCPSGPAEILGNGKWGRLVSVSDVNALAAAMVATLDESTHPDVATRASDFGVDQVVMDYLRVLLPPISESDARNVFSQQV